MKTAISGFLLALFCVALVSAQTFQVEGTVGVQSGTCDVDIDTQENLPTVGLGTVTPDYNTQDGSGLYVYCTWQLTTPSDEDGQTLIPMNAGDTCPSVQQSTTYEYGDTAYNAVVTSVDVTYNNGWQFGNPQILDQVEITHNACYPSPDPSFVQSIVAFILNWMCNTFPFFSWCA